MLLIVLLCLSLIASSVLSAADPNRASSYSPSSVTPTYASSQPESLQENLWLEIDERSLNGKQQTQSAHVYRTLKLNRLGLALKLAQAPREFSAEAQTKPIELALPLADGSYQNFRVIESSIMEPELAARFPEIKTYRGYSIEDPSVTTRFDWMPSGFHGIILSAAGTTLIEPYVKNDTENYICYFQSNVSIDSSSCEVTEAQQEAAIAQQKAAAASRPITSAVTSGANLRTYRLAVAATAEYTQFYGGGTVNGGLAAITTTVNFVNAIYQRDVAVRLVLVAGETSIIFTDPATDGYTSNNVFALVNENQTKLDAVIGSANYDIGHVFDGRSNGGGFSFQGQVGAIGSVCQSGLKARAATITRSVFPSDTIAYYITAHEMGHQFSATHTFNASTGDCGSQRSPSTAYEPGTGSTIMGYRFNCGTQDLMSEDTYFHNASIQQIVNYTTAGNGGACPALSPTSNLPPNVTTAAGYVIPHNTPFTLTATGTDPDRESLSYSWEQFDLGNPSPPNTDDGSRPLFRSSLSFFSSTRDFFGSTLPSTLPTTNRTMNFRVTARDNHSGGGGVNSAATQIQVTTNSGPFTVTQPALNAQWGGNTQQTVTWNVANTTSAPVNCANVSIFMSGGNGFPIVLALETPNDGSETITIPQIPGESRIKVVGRGNIFFNISEQFRILGPHIPQPSISGFSPGSGDIGTPVTITGTNFTSLSSVTFNGVPATFEVRSTTEIVAIVPDGVSTGPIAVRASGLTATSATNFIATGASSIQLDASSFTQNEADGAANITLSRTGLTSGAATVRYTTSDTAGLNNCNVVNGVASARCDYTIFVGTARFAAGETSKTISVPLVDDAFAEGNETFTITLSNATGVILGSPNVATVTITDNETGNKPNPVDNTPFFVRQQYLDFLNREPDPGGFAGWQAILNGCAPGDITCDRIHVSSAFFRSPEFQERGYFVYRFYPVSFGRKPDYAEFIPDFAKVSGFLTDAELEVAKQTLIAEFMSRTAFVTKFNGLTNTAYVDTLLSTAGITHANRDSWITSLGNGARTRAQVLREIAETTEVYNKYFNQAFVVMQYFGYLRREPDSLYLNWISHLDSTNDYRSMINGFMNSPEYRFRFGP